MTHFATADGSSLEQTERPAGPDERSRAPSYRAHLGPEVLVHTHNSAATVRLPGSRQGMVRVGAGCSGVRTSQEFDNPAGLRPVMSFRTWVAQVRQDPSRPHHRLREPLHHRARQHHRRAPRGLRRRVPAGALQQGHRPHPRSPLPGGGPRLPERHHGGRDRLATRRCSWGDEAVLIGRQGGEEVTFEEMADKFSSVRTEST